MREEITVNVEPKDDVVVIAVSKPTIWRIIVNFFTVKISTRLTLNPK